MAPGGVEPPEACGLLSTPSSAWGVANVEIILGIIKARVLYASETTARNGQGSSNDDAAINPYSYTALNGQSRCTDID